MRALGLDPHYRHVSSRAQCFLQMIVYCLPAVATGRHAFMFLVCGLRILCCFFRPEYLAYLSRVQPTKKHEAVVSTKNVVRAGLFNPSHVPD